MSHPKTNLYESIWQQKLKTGGRSPTNRVKEAIKELTPGYRALDIGCGEGLFGSLAKDHFHHICGVDCSRAALKAARSKGVDALVADLDERHLPFNDGSFDWISCLDVIEHVFEPEHLLHEIYRVLHHNGTLTLTTPNIRFIDFINPLLLKGVFPKTSQDSGSYDGGHLHYFTFRDIKKLLSKVGFTVVRERGYDEKKYFSAKVLAFKMMMKLWEKEINKEFFCQGILVTAIKI
jgi:methionine biosynthesis protein MetW